jgi:hypothetical protein
VATSVAGVPPRGDELDAARAAHPGGVFVRRSDERGLYGAYVVGTGATAAAALDEGGG